MVSEALRRLGAPIDACAYCKRDFVLVSPVYEVWGSPSSPHWRFRARLRGLAYFTCCSEQCGRALEKKINATGGTFAAYHTIWDAGFS